MLCVAFGAQFLISCKKSLISAPAAAPSLNLGALLVVFHQILSKTFCRVLELGCGGMGWGHPEHPGMAHSVSLRSWSPQRLLILLP